MLDLVETHKDLLLVINDADKLREALAAIVSGNDAKINELWKNYAASSEGSIDGFIDWAMKNGRTISAGHALNAKNVWGESTTLQDLLNAKHYGDSTWINDINEYLQELADSADGATKEVEALKDAATETIEYLEKAKALNEAVNGIDPSSSSYDPTKVISNFATLEKEFPE
jgi:hypothetical protein